MKLIEALKKTKDLSRKADDILNKIQLYCCDMDYENPTYPDQKGQVNSWLQAHRDIIKEIGRLKYCIQKTNVLTQVTIDLGENSVTKSITEWIERRKSLAAMEKQAWSRLQNKGLKDVRLQNTSGIIYDSKVRYYFDPVQKDKMIEILSAEPSLIDAKLEIVNAVTDLVE